MSFHELLEAIRGLTEDEKRRLVHTLVDELGQSREEQLVRRLGIVPGTVFDIWLPEVSSADAAQAFRALQERRGV